MGTLPHTAQLIILPSGIVLVSKSLANSFVPPIYLFVVERMHIVDELKNHFWIRVHQPPFNRSPVSLFPPRAHPPSGA